MAAGGEGAVSPGDTRRLDWAELCDQVAMRECCAWAGLMRELGRVIEGSGAVVYAPHRGSRPTRQRMRDALLK